MIRISSEELREGDVLVTKGGTKVPVEHIHEVAHGRYIAVVSPNGFHGDGSFLLYKGAWVNVERAETTAERVERRIAELTVAAPAVMSVLREEGLL